MFAAEAQRPPLGADGHFPAQLFVLNWPDRIIRAAAGICPPCVSLDHVSTLSRAKQKHFLATGYTVLMFLLHSDFCSKIDGCIFKFFAAGLSLSEFQRFHCFCKSHKNE